MKIGCNYWASHAGTRMWELWDENVVRQDLKLLAENGCELLRVFPNWRDFQPIEVRQSCGGHIKDIYLHGKPRPDTFCGRAGVDEEMIRRFRRLAEIAHEYKLSLRVAIVTGWMSGSIYCPPALENTNVQTDPLALRYMVQFIRCFVHMLKDCPAIEEWELGNECNNLGRLPDSHSAWLWIYLVSSAIRLEDPTRKVASGMHGLTAADEHAGGYIWSIQSHGELCDRMTPHPYPQSGGKTIAKVDAQDSIRTMLESTIEMLYYGDIVDRPSCVEEIGTFASSYASETLKALFLRGALYNCWAHGATDFLWWCAFDQDHLQFPPYWWSAFERELGMFDMHNRPKKFMDEFLAFKAFKDNLPIEELPPFQRDAVCVITREQGFDTGLSNAGNALLLAKQNKFDLRYRFTSERRADAPLYILPGLSGDGSLYTYEWQQLIEKVENGAVLYVSLDSCAISMITALFGVEVSGRERRTVPATVDFEGEKFLIPSEFKTYLEVIDGEVLAREEDGNPVFVRKQYGKGWCYLLTLPLEKALSGVPGAFHKPEQPAWRKFYAPLAEHVRSRRRIFCSDPLVTLTEHPESEDVCWAVAVNNGKETANITFEAAAGWEVEENAEMSVAPFTGKLLKLIRKN